MSTELNRKYLRSIEITHEGLQDEALLHLPCGEVLIKNVMKDRTSLDSNAPRAISIIAYKGFLDGLHVAQRFLDRPDIETTGDKFLDHLQESEKIVRRWPEGEQNLLR